MLLYYQVTGKSLEFDYFLENLEIDQGLISSFFEKFKEEVSRRLIFLFIKETPKVILKSVLNDTEIFSSSSVAAITRISYDDNGRILGANIILI